MVVLSAQSASLATGPAVTSSTAAKVASALTSVSATRCSVVVSCVLSWAISACCFCISSHMSSRLGAAWTVVTALKAIAVVKIFLYMVNPSPY